MNARKPFVHTPLTQSLWRIQKEQVVVCGSISAVGIFKVQAQCQPVSDDHFRRTYHLPVDRLDDIAYENSCGLCGGIICYGKHAGANFGFLQSDAKLLAT